jgi:C4-dicarboxylate-specific signal transduction histidine kinase
LDSTALQPLAAAIHGDALAAALTWVARAQNVHVLLREIGESSTRVSDIVGALKDYSYLRQSSLQSVDLHKGIDSTLLIMATRFGEGIEIPREYGENVPSIQAYGSELNQVWTNLLGDAVDAVNGRGQIIIRTRRDGDWVAVEIEDNGPGILAEIRPRIFDPFFTTKPPGKGVGLGLSVVHSIISRSMGVRCGWNVSRGGRGLR